MYTAIQYVFVPVVCVWLYLYDVCMRMRMCEAEGKVDGECEKQVERRETRGEPGGEPIPQDSTTTPHRNRP